MRVTTTDCIHFSDRLTALVKERGPICAGIDPRPKQMPQPQDEVAAAKWGEEVAKLLADKVAVLKPQIAFFMDEWTAVDQIGIAAMEGGALVIGDCKRGDIGSTAQAYADRILGYASTVNAVTLNPYLGRDSLTPFVDKAVQMNKGVFILVKTSNPGSKDIQDLKTDSMGMWKVWEHVAKMVDDLGKEHLGKDKRSCVGAVVGLTNTVEEVKRCRELMPNAWFLMPGYGAQGGNPEVYKAALDKRGGGVIVSASRSLTLPWQGPAPREWKKRIEIELKVMKEELKAYA